jgi:hypothetical protein
MSTSRRTLLAILAAVCACALLAFPATGAAAFKTKIVVSLKFPAFHGKVTSPRGACLGNRKVKLFRERNGKKVLLGRDRSNAKGKWAVPIGKKIPPGSYYATVAKTGKCKGDKSSVLPIG